MHLPGHAPSCGSPRVSCGLHIGISTSQAVHGFKALYGLFDPTNTILSLESQSNTRTDTYSPARSEMNVNDVWNSTQTDIGKEADECCDESISSVGPYRAKWLRSRGRGKWRRGRKTSGTSRGEFQLARAKRETPPDLDHVLRWSDVAVYRWQRRTPSIGEIFD